MGRDVTTLARAWRVYNELAETRPDLVRILSENWDVEVPFFCLYCPR